MSPSVRKNAQASQFEISVDDADVGLLRFVDHTPREGSTQRVMFHTEIDEAFGGRGLAGVLVSEALEMTRAEGLAVVAVCPYVKKFASMRPEYDDLVVPTTDEALRAIRRDA